MISLPLRRFTRDEYRQAAQAGIIRPDERLELLDGQIVEKMTRNPPHAVCISLILAWLSNHVGGTTHVRPQLPIALSGESEPEPDVAVAIGLPGDYSLEHPTANDLELVIEVSDATLERDRRLKAPLYSQAGIRELWVLDVYARKIEIYREPSNIGYRVVTILMDTEIVCPLFSPEAAIRVSDLLPPAGSPG